MSETKPCACGCGELIVRRLKDGKSKWEDRRYFSKACRNRAHAALMRDKGGVIPKRPSTQYQIAVNAAHTINEYWHARGKIAGAHVVPAGDLYVVRSNLVGGVPR